MADYQLSVLLDAPGTGWWESLDVHSHHNRTRSASLISPRLRLKEPICANMHGEIRSQLYSTYSGISRFRYFFHTEFTVAMAMKDLSNDSLRPEADGQVMTFTRSRGRLFRLQFFYRTQYSADDWKLSLLTRMLQRSL